ncbi:MAG: Na+/H+ antiporter subunit E [Candidatus Omnitrophica bacterium]|nr:Na+/H+ antiporter subunit E [Candidatus Omnitrophota bacterium]
MQSRVILFILGFLIWLFLNWPPYWQEIFIGAIVASFVAYLVGNLFTGRAHLFKHISRYLWFLYYIPIFIWECFKANIDVAIRVISPHKPLNPGIVKIKTSLKSDTALTFLANSITLTPGTLTVDVDKENGFLYVHWIDVKSKDIEKNTQIIVRKFEKILEKIFE